VGLGLSEEDNLHRFLNIGLMHVVTDAQS